MKSVSKLKELYEIKKEATDPPANNKDRRYSSTIKDKVCIYEKQIEELEEKRKNFNLFELSKKFNLHKHLNKENSDNLEYKYVQNEEIIDFVKEMEVICDNYEKEIHFYKRKISAIGKNRENGQGSKEEKENINDGTII